MPSGSRVKVIVFPLFVARMLPALSAFTVRPVNSALLIVNVCAGPPPRVVQLAGYAWSYM